MFEKLEDAIKEFGRQPDHDLGENHYLFFCDCFGRATSGFYLTHQHTDGTWHVASGMFSVPGLLVSDPENVYWDIVNMDPITISPSMRCPSCPDEGWVRGGRWVTNDSNP